MDTITEQPVTDTPAPARKPARARVKKTPRGDTVTAYLLRAIMAYDINNMGGGTSRFLINHIATAHGVTLKLQVISATLAILRNRGMVRSERVEGDAQGRLLYFLTDKGLAKLNATLGV